MEHITISNSPPDADHSEHTIAEEYDTELAEFPTPQAGDVVGRRFVIESTVGLRRFTARDRQTGALFEVRTFNWLTPSSPVFHRAVANARTCSLVGHAQLGVVTTVSSCATFGPFAALSAMSGTPLLEMLRAGELSAVDEVVRFALEIGSALGAIHDVGVASGLIDLNDVVLTEERTWKLRAPGLPAAPDALWRVRPPEMPDRDEPTPAGDQWSFAAVLYHMLVGTFPAHDEKRAPGRRRTDVPDLLDKAIMRALSTKPAERWSQMEDILDALQRGFYTWRRPSMVPMDAREVSRLLKLHPDIAQKDFSRERTRQSVVVRIEDVRASKPKLAISFRNIARLRREYRHNLAHGGLFVPTNEPPVMGSEVSVQIQLVQNDTTVDLTGVVSNVEQGDEGSPPGVGIIFDAASVERLQAYLREVGVVKGLRASDVVMRLADFDAETLGAEELFLYSMTMGTCTLGHLRSESSSLPFDFEETLYRLIDVGAIVVEPGKRENDVRKFQPLRPGVQRELTVSGPLRFASEDVELLLEHVDYHESRHAQLAAEALVERGLMHLPDDPRLLHRKAVLLARGMTRLGEAREAARRAMELDPRRRDYRDTVTWIDSLMEREAVRCIYSRVFPVTEIEFLGWDAPTHRVWVSTRSRLQPVRVRVLGIDVQRDTIVHSETIDGASAVHAVWERRSHSGKPPAIWKGDTRPAAVSADGEWWAFEREPDGQRRGVWIGKAGGSDWVELAGEDEATFGVQFAPRRPQVVWQAIADGLTKVYVGGARGRTRLVYESKGVVHTVWDNRHDLIVFDSENGVVARIGEGSVEAIAQVEPGFTRALTDGLNDSVLVYERDTTDVVWVNHSGVVRGRLSLDEPFADACLRSDGLLVARTREGVLTANLGRGTTRTIAGIRLCPTAFRRAGWATKEPFVMMRVLPNALELVSVDAELLQS